MKRGEIHCELYAKKATAEFSPGERLKHQLPVSHLNLITLFPICVLNRIQKTNERTTSNGGSLGPCRNEISICIFLYVASQIKMIPFKRYFVKTQRARLTHPVV